MSLTAADLRVDASNAPAAVAALFTRFTPEMLGEPSALADPTPIIKAAELLIGARFVAGGTVLLYLNESNGHLELSKSMPGADDDLARCLNWAAGVGATTTSRMRLSSDIKSLLTRTYIAGESAQYSLAISPHSVVLGGRVIWLAPED